MSVMKLNNSFTLSIMVALMFLTCTTGDRNNPLDPGNPDHIDKPVAYLRVSDTTIFINDTLVLTGSCENNEFLDYYIWRIGSKTETTESGNKNFVWKDSGKYVIEMRVIDKYKQKSEWVSCKVKVLTGQPTVTFDSSIFSTTIRDSITIIPYHYDENGTIKHYIWQYTSGKETLCDTTDTIPRKFVWKDFGKKVLSLRVIDDDNLVSHTAICTVLVGLGAVPTVSIISDTSCFINDTIKIKADGKDQNGTVEKYIWSWTGSKKEDTTTSSTNSFIWPDSGYKTVTVWAVDNDGQISKPDTCVVTVSSGAPIITKINDTVASTTMGCKIILNAKTDSRLSSDNVMWLWDTGAPGWDDSTSGKTHTFNQNSGGKLRVIWAAKVDGKALSIKDTFFITFNRPPEEPKLSLPDKDIAQWISISSSGKGSVEFKWEGSDPDSNTDISSFHFTLNTESGNNVFKYTGPDKFCTVSNLDTLKKYNWRLVSKDRFGDSAFAEGSITTSFGLPIIISQPQGITIAKGDSLKLHIGVAGRGTLSYQWKKDGVDISSKDSSYYLKKGASYSDSGYYKCIISNSSGSVTSDSVKVVVLPVKPKIIKHPVSDTVQRGSSAYFTITAEGDFLQYQWQKNGIDIQTNGNNDTLILDSVTLADNGAKFCCIVSNGGGKVISDTVTLSVTLVPPTVTVQPIPAKVSVGQIVTFKIFATGDGIEYQWQKDGVDLAGGKGDSLQINPVMLSDSGFYRCVVKNSAGSDTSNSVQLTVCKIYFKYRTLVILDSMDNDSDGYYSMFNVYYDPDVSDSGVANINVKLNYKNSSATSYTNLWNSPEHVEINGTDTVDYSIDNVFTGNQHGEYDYQLILFSGNTPVDTIYSLGHKEELPSENEIPPEITLNPSDLVIEAGQSATFIVSATGTNLQYQWQKNGVDITTNGNSDKLNIDIATLADNGAVFRCIVSNAAGKDTSSIAVLTVKLAPPVIVTDPKAITVTEGGTARFDVVATGDSLKYQWQKDRINIEGENSDSLYIFNAAFEDSGNYRCIVWNSAGQDTSNEAKLKVRALPKYNLTTSVMPSGGGSVTLSPSGGTYDSGTVVTLTASPTSEYNFLHWIDGNSIWTWTSLTVTMTGNKSIIAYFEVKKSKFTLTTSVQPTGGGSISLSPSGGTYDSGTVVTLTASPASGYDFLNWSGNATGTSTSATVTMTGNKSITANFSLHISKFTLTTAVLPTTGGSISLSPSGGIYDSGTVVTLTATRASGYDFSSWTGSTSGTSTSINVTMTGNKTVTANFVKVTGPVGTCIINYIIGGVQYQFTITTNGNTGTAVGGRCDIFNCYNEATYQLKDFGESTDGYFYNMIPLTSGWNPGSLFLERRTTGWYFTTACFTASGCTSVTQF